MTQSEVTASVANLWELLLKRHKPGALLADPLPWWERYVRESGISALAIRAAHVMTLGRLPELHKDPFDRILISQSIKEDIPIVTVDRQFELYKADVIWAG